MNQIFTKTTLIAVALAVAACSATPVRRSFKETWNDTMTAQKLRYKLMKDSEVKKSHMHVTVFRGQVTLTGRAVSDAEKARAEQLAKSVKRVTAVDNYIHVVGDGKAAATTTVAQTSKPGQLPTTATAIAVKPTSTKTGVGIEETTLIVEKEKIVVSEDDVPARVPTIRVGTGSGQSVTTVAAPARKSVPVAASKTKPKETKIATVKKTPAVKPAATTAAVAPTKKAQPVTTPVKEAAVAAMKETSDVPLSSVPASKVVGKSKTGLPWDGEVYEDDASSVKSSSTASRVTQKSGPVTTTATTASAKAPTPQAVAPASPPAPTTDDLAKEAAQELEKLRSKK